VDFISLQVDFTLLPKVSVNSFAEKNKKERLKLNQPFCFLIYYTVLGGQPLLS